MLTRLTTPFTDLEHTFQSEPIPETLMKGQRLLLSCSPPKGEPAPKVNNVFEIWAFMTYGQGIDMTTSWLKIYHLFVTGTQLGKFVT